MFCLPAHLVEPLSWVRGLDGKDKIMEKFRVPWDKESAIDFYASISKSFRILYSISAGIHLLKDHRSEKRKIVIGIFANPFAEVLDNSVEILVK